MAETQRKYQGSLTFGKLDSALEAHEMLFGKLVKLEVIGAFSVATFDDSDYPPLHTLALMPLIGGNTPPEVQGATHLFNSEALILEVKVGLAVFRTM
jgi:hypothetical protein